MYKRKHLRTRVWSNPRVLRAAEDHPLTSALKLQHTLGHCETFATSSDVDRLDLAREEAITRRE